MHFEEFMSAMSHINLKDVRKKVVVHAPALLPEGIIFCWESMGRRFPGLFDRFALEFVIWGSK